MSSSASSVARPAMRGWDGRALLLACAYIVTYTLVDWLSNVKPLLSLGISPWNPQAGLALAFLLYFGPRWLPVAVAAAVVSDVLALGTSVLSPANLCASVWIASTYAVLAGILQRWQL